jgi:hypothetical protein
VRWKADAEAAVAKREWTMGPRHDPEPFICERRGSSPGRLLKKKPRNLDSRFEYGFDPIGRVVYERQGVEIQDQFYETFYRYSEGLIERARYDYFAAKSPIAFTRLALGESGRVVLAETVAVAGSSRERYVWSGERVTRIEVDHVRRQRRGVDEPEPVPFAVFEIAYDVPGARFEVHGSSGRKGRRLP